MSSGAPGTEVAIVGGKGDVLRPVLREERQRGDLDQVVLGWQGLHMEERYVRSNLL